MNFLGHAYFSPPNNDKALAGNVFGDFVKGNLEKQNFPDDIKKGLQYHRYLDALCDKCAGFISFKHLLSNDYSHYKGIIADILIDHLLAREWHYFSGIPLEEFSEITSRKLESCISFFPPRVSRIFNFMQNENWFILYSFPGFIEDTLKRIERYSGHGIIISTAVSEFLCNQEKFSEQFFLFIKEMKEHTK